MSFTGSLGTQSNRADWTGWLRITAADDGVEIDLSPLTIRLQVRMQPYPMPGYGYGYGYDTWGPRTGGPILSGGTDSGELTVPAAGILQWNFPAARMNALGPGLYDVGMLVEDASGNKQQLIIGTLAVYEGGVF